jgi:hypothetical protein
VNEIVTTLDELITEIKDTVIELEAAGKTEAAALLKVFAGTFAAIKAEIQKLVASL